MSAISFQLFGKFCAHCSERELDVHALKEQELLSYLLVYRNRPHSREMLASLLWGDSSTEKSKKYLRQALWHLQSALEPKAGAASGVLVIGNEWVQLNAEAEMWLDVAEFEQAFALAQGVTGCNMTEAFVEALQKAVQVYRGDLLEGWYQDWCLFERERLQNIYFLILDKLMSYCEAHRDYEKGQIYGSLILRYDHARERTHRQLMQFYYNAGDRTAALRQYERCAAALDEELGIKPERATTALYEQIRADGCEIDQADVRSVTEEGGAVSLAELLNRLRHLQSNLANVQRQVQQDIKAVELTLSKGR
ncbi:MAG TPA: BTAD domain-containing putative transcriptional regulator [Pyrinomonadaceae bacterium]